MSHQQRRSYDLDGVIVSVLADEERCATFLDRLLSKFLLADERNADWTISVSHSETIEEPPAGVELIWDGPLPEGIPSLCHADDERRVITAPDRFVMKNSRMARTTEIKVIRDHERAIGGTVAFWLLDDVLGAHDRHLLHGACLIDHQSEHAFALFAPSGTGKTTTALALARSGLSLAGDDALVLRNRDDASYLWGIPRYSKVHRKTVELLPWLRPYAANTGVDEQMIELDQLKPAITLGSTTSHRAGAAIILRKPNTTAHQVTQLTKAEALSLITTDNIRRLPGGVDGAARSTFAAVARFIAQTPTIALSVGPNPSTLNADLIRNAL